MKKFLWKLGNLFGYVWLIYSAYSCINWLAKGYFLNYTLKNTFGVYFYTNFIGLDKILHNLIFQAPIGYFLFCITMICYATGEYN